MNIKVETGSENIEKVKSKVKKANAKKEIPTIEESWKKIMSMKNSSKDKEQIGRAHV